MRAKILRRAPTGLGVAIGVTGGILLAWGLLGAGEEILIAASLMLGALLSGYAIVRMQAARVASGLRRGVYGELVEGAMVVVRLEIDNSKAFIPLLASIRDRPPGQGQHVEGMIVAPPGGRGYFDYEVVARSGKRRFGTVTVSLRDPLGLYEATMEVDPEERHISAAPVPVAPREVVEIAVEEAPARALLKRGPGIEFHSVREYVEGDDYRLIEWKATARLQKLMVKELRVEASTPIVLVMIPGPSGDVGEPGNTFFETAARILAGLAVDTTSRGSPVGYIGLVEDSLVLQPPSPGVGGAESVLRGIASTPPSGGVPRGSAAVVREYLHVHIRGPALLLAAAGPEVVDEARRILAEAVEGTRVKAGLLLLGEKGVSVEWVG